METVEQLKQEAQAARNKAESLRYESDKYFQIARRLEAQAAELIAPFKLGDIIEIETTQGYGSDRKHVKRRLKVATLTIGSNGIHVSGRQVNAQGEISHRNRLSFTLGADRDKFLRIANPTREDAIKLISNAAEREQNDEHLTYYERLKVITAFETNFLPFNGYPQGKPESDKYIFIIWKVDALPPTFPAGITTPEDK